MSSLRDELLSEPLIKRRVVIRGKQFTILEADDGELGRLMASCRKADGKWIAEDMVDCKLLSRCVKDAEEKDIFGLDEWKEWRRLGRGWTGPLRREVMSLNGLDNDDVGIEVKNSDTTTSSV
jgi:hypothetical protein